MNHEQGYISLRKQERKEKLGKIGKKIKDIAIVTTLTAALGYAFYTLNKTTNENNGIYKQKGINGLYDHLKEKNK